MKELTAAGAIEVRLLTYVRHAKQTDVSDLGELSIPGLMLEAYIAPVVLVPLEMGKNAIKSS